MTDRFLPVAEPDISGNEKRYVNEALDSGWISSNGKFIGRFEEEFAAYCGTSHAVACCNGTVAIHLLMLAMGIGEGDEVLVPSFTYIASANAVTYTGATPVLVDSETEHWNVDTAKLEQAITPRTKAIMAVHLYGHPADMLAIDQVAKRHGLLVIEDAAEAHGAEVEGRRVGGLSLAATFSFYGNKIITTGEGGMVTTNDEQLAKKMRSLRGQGMDPERRYWFPIVGYNYRMTNVAAAIGCGQLERIDSFLERRREIAGLYIQLLEPHCERYGMQLPGEAIWAKNVHWLMCLRVPVEFRDRLMQHLMEHSIDSRPFFPPLHELPIYSAERFHGGRDLSGATELGATGMNLPTSNTMTTQDVKRVCDCILGFFEGLGS